MSSARTEDSDLIPISAKMKAYRLDALKAETLVVKKILLKQSRVESETEKE